MTPAQLATATGCRSISRASSWLPAIEDTMRLYGIDTLRRKAAFLAQLGHESGGLVYVREIWGPTPTQRRYEGRADLGNTQPGDGRKFAGHGLIQVTGRFNHAACRDRMRKKFPDMNIPDFEERPEDLTLAPWAALSAGDFWDSHNLNKWADAGDFDGVCDIVNRGRKTQAEGDSNGYRERLALYTAGLRALL